MRLAKQKIGAQQNGYGRIGCDIEIYKDCKLSQPEFQPVKSAR